MLQCIAAVISAGYPRERFEFLRHFSVFNIVSCKYWFFSVCLQYSCILESVYMCGYVYYSTVKSLFWREPASVLS